MSATPYGEAKAIDTLLAGAYVSLHTGVPTPENEIANGGYVRRPLGAYSKVGSDPTVSTNDEIIEWPTALADYAAGAYITHFGLWDALTAGNMTVEGPMLQPKQVFAGDLVRFPVGTLTIRCT